MAAFSSTDNLVISPSPEHDMKQSSSPPQWQQQQQQQPEKWAAQGAWFGHLGNLTAGSLCNEIKHSPLTLVPRSPPFSPRGWGLGTRLGWTHLQTCKELHITAKTVRSMWQWLSKCVLYQCEVQPVGVP